jgi:hypothetical protein
MKLMNKGIEVQFEKTRLFKPYISKKIEPGTLQKVLDSPYQTAYRLYLISNGIKELQDFASISSEEYDLTAYVKTECGFIGDASKQVWSITHLQPLLQKKPLYTIRCELRHLMTNNIIYKCTLSHKNPDVIYNQIQECIDNLKEILK